MAKLTLTDLANLENENTAVTAINANNALIEAAIENTLSRDGTSPNTMSDSLDMNSNTILNLPAAATSTEPVRMAEFTSAVAALASGYPEGVSAFALTLLDDTDQGTMQTTLGLAPGTDVQSYNADLAVIAALSPSNDDVLQRKSSAWTNRTMTQLTADLDVATASLQGVVELATEAEAAARTDTSRGITPFNNPFPPGFIYGLTLSNNSSDATNDIDIAAGSARDSTDAVNLILSSGLTKRLDATWSVGTGNGGLDTGSIANTTYHVYLIKRSDTGVVDVLFSTSASSPTMPTNYDYKRRIGSIIRSSGAILLFHQYNDNFVLDNRVADVAFSTLSGYTAAGVATAMGSIPLGIQVRGIFSVYLAISSSSERVYITSMNETDTGVSGGYFTIVEDTANKDVMTDIEVEMNTNRQLRIRAAYGVGVTAFDIMTRGWKDSRGRFG